MAGQWWFTPLIKKQKKKRKKEHLSEKGLHQVKN
jgi:hypothetical protein